MNRLIASDDTEKLVQLPANPKRGSDGSYYIDCPFCPPRRSTGRPDTRKKLNINDQKPDITLFRCNRCGTSGIVDDEKYSDRKRIKSIDIEPKIVEINDNVIKWFDKVRKISLKSLEKLKIYSTYQTLRQENNKDQALVGQWIRRLVIAYPYIRNGHVINIKYRDADKNFKLVKGADKIPYNLDSIKGYDYCVWVEGENDVAAYTECGINPVISPPNGATITIKEKEEYEKTGKILKPTSLNMSWLEPVYNDFRETKRHYIATDNDGPGYKLREELVRRFGKDKCYLINFDEYKYKEDEDSTEYKISKDPNEVLIRFGKEELQSTIEKARPYPVDDIITIADSMPKLIQEFKHGKEKGLTTGYQSIDPYFTWKPGQTTVLNGYPGEGKTTFGLNLIALSIILHGYKWLIYSPENYPPSNLIDTMVEIIVGSSSDMEVKTRMSLSQYISAAKRVLFNNIYFADREEGFSPEQFREKSLEMIMKHGINATFTDPWRGMNHNHKGRNIDEYLEYEIGMENRFATTHNIIRLISHHPPTPDRKEKNVSAPTPWHLKGGEIWYARVWNILCIHREDKFSFENLKSQFWSQKIKENKLVGVVTDKSNPVLLNFERKSQRLQEYRDINGTARLKWPGEEINISEEYKLF